MLEENDLLDTINSTQDLKKVSKKDLQKLSEQIREVILQRVSKVGGHLGPNLGDVELTVALHYVFNSPVDKIVWDVSHQSYTHKVLTGRRQQFEDFDDTISISGFTNKEESEHDLFNLGHTSTSISLASGLAKARDIKGTNENIIAVIGDGSLSGGEAYEGLDNVAEFNSNFIVVINDNEMSIAENHGGIYKNLAELRKSNGLASNNIFKAIGFDYVYIEAGNDVEKLVDEFEKVKNIDRPIVVHVHTLKGKGYKYSEQEKERFHWTVPFNIDTGKGIYTDNSVTYKSTVIDYISKKVEENNNIVVINAATPGALGLVEFRNKYPDKYFDVGIAEEHAIAFASGLASQNIRPIAMFMSTFIQRTYDQISQDLCINNNPALIIVEGAGIAGADVTHNGMYDISMLSNIPNLVYLAPANKAETEKMIDWSLKQVFPIAIRVPGGKVDELKHSLSLDIKLNKYEKVVEGEKIAILGLGHFFKLAEALEEKLMEKGIHPTLINPRFITDIDKELLNDLLKNHQTIVTLEDGILNGGFGEKISRFYGNKNVKVYNFGADKEFTDRVPLDVLYERYNLNVDDILSKILE